MTSELPTKRRELTNGWVYFPIKADYPDGQELLEKLIQELLIMKAVLKAQYDLGVANTDYPNRVAVQFKDDPPKGSDIYRVVDKLTKLGVAL